MKVWLFILATFGFAHFLYAEELTQPNAYARVSSDGKAAIATVNPYSSGIAMEVIARGGNAVDAAVAAAFTLGVVDGQNSGIGGGCFILVRLANGNIFAIDGREMAPEAAKRDMFLENGKANPELSRTGALAIGIPGSVMALHKLQQLGGALKFSDVVLPAANLAEAGFPISNTLAERISSTSSKLAQFPASAAIFLDKDNKPLPAKTIIQQKDLAATYRAIAKQGPNYFYRGDFAAKTARWMKANGGIVNKNDFANYQIKMRKPVISEFAGYTFYGFPPPSSGGTHVAQILNILEQFDLKKATPAERYHLMAEAMKFAFADRAHWLGDSDFTAIPAGLTDKDYAKTIATKISLEKAASDITFGNPDIDIEALKNKHTTHISAADTAGNWIAITTTVNTSFGSKVVIPGTGVVMNNQMDDFSAQVGVQNAFGLVGSNANSVQSGKRPLSSMSPTLVFKDDKPVMTVGAAGGPTIISQVMQTLLYTLNDGLTAEQALAQPRIHQQWNPNLLFVEAAMPDTVQQSLKQKGHELKIWPTMGATQVIQLRDGKLVPVAEPRVIAQNSK